ncbi:hypothetical protein [Marinifilum sp.]|uniref:hypothetical protein n=1 Tax=Marinifilum sp. TaxID=2033137 RepID=UPI003BACAE69
MIKTTIVITVIIFIALITNAFFPYLKRFENLTQLSLTILGTFLAVVMGLYFNRLEMQNTEKDKTIELIEAGMMEIKNCQSLLSNGYLTELAKYDGKYRQYQNVNHMGNSFGISYPFPSFLEGFSKNELLIRNTSFSMQNSIQYALHNMKNSVRFMNENHRYKENKDEQFLKDYRDYYSFFSYCYQVLKLEVKYLKSSSEISQKEEGFRQLTEKMIAFTKNPHLNEFLNHEFVLHVAMPSELCDTHESK